MRKVVGVLAILFAGHANAQTIEPPLLSGTDIPPGVTAPKLVDKQIPFSYPLIAIRCHMTGSATLELLISAQGTVEDAKVTTASGYKVLDEAAINRAKQFHYAPATKDGAPIASRIQVAMDYRLPPPNNPPCNLPPQAYSDVLPPNSAPIESLESSQLKPGERLLADASIHMMPQTLTRQKLHVPAGGEALRIDYSMNPPGARVRLMVLTGEQDREAMSGSQPTGPFALDSVIIGGGHPIRFPAGRRVLGRVAFRRRTKRQNRFLSRGCCRQLIDRWNSKRARSIHLG